MSSRVHDLLFDVERSYRYHRERVRFFDIIANATSFVGIVLSSYAVVSLVGMWPPVAAIVLLALVAILNSIVLVFNVSGKARLHSVLAADFLRLEQRITRVTTPTDDQYRQFVIERREIEIREPPHLKVLNLLVYNRVCLARGQTEFTYSIDAIQRFFKHIMDINPDKIIKRDANQG